MSSQLESILARVERSDPATAKELRRHIAMLDKRREFGLNFKRHLPEQVNLPGYPITVGDKVVFLPPRGETTAESTDTWVVESIGGGAAPMAHLRSIESGEPAQRAVEDLVYAADFRDRLYPGLESVERIENGDGPFHTVINGENFHVLDALRYTHAEAIDLIYIDPPYNTGNEGWIYNDRYVAAEDGEKHSMWLAFIERRLKLAHGLLKPTGVIIVAIGDDEHHRLRMLMDQVFGDQNFISNVVWQGGRKNDSRYVSNGADYMLIYAKSESALKDTAVRWREARSGVDEVLAAAKEAWSQAEGATVPERVAEAQAALRAWQRALPKDHPARGKGLSDFTKIDENGDVYRYKDISWPGGGGPRYDVLHPVTKQPVKVPGRGWIFSTQERMQEEIDAGLVVFGADHDAYINRKSLLRESDSMCPESVFTQKRTGAGAHLQSVLGDRRFPFPKDHEVLMRWIRMATPRDAVVLDFFGGSGTTTEAVIRLNAEDGGTRQAILVTNNELAAKDAKRLRNEGFRDGDPDWEARGIFEHVTRPRISTVVTGKRPDGSTYSDGIAANVEFFNLTYENPALIEVDAAFERIAPLLWLKAGGTGSRVDKPTGDYVIASTYAVLFNLDAVAPFLTALKVADGIATVYVVTDDEPQYQAVARQLPKGAAAVRLYSSYLHTFQINNGLAE